MNDLQPRQSWGFAEVLRLSWPAGLSMLNATLMRFVDGWMVSRLGYETSAAQFNAGLTSFVPESFAMGVLIVVNTYVSQNFGAGRFRRCGQYAWAGFLLALGYCVLVAPAAVFAPQIFDLFPKEGHTDFIRQQETMYFRYMILAIFFTLTARPIEQFFFGIHRPRVVLAASLLANGLNLLGDYVLIFGMWGFPKMGLEGAAIATVASWGLMLAILLMVFLSPSIHRRYATRGLRLVRGRQMKDLLKIGWPAGVQFVNDILPWMIFTGVIVAWFGPDHFAASTFAMRWMPLSFMPAVGIGIATTALVGRYIGEGRPEMSKKRVHAALLTAMIYMGVCATAFLVFGRDMVRIFATIDPEFATLGPVEAAEQLETIVRIGGQVMICAAVFQLFDAVGIVYIGALRGAGDTLAPMIVTVLASWGLTIGGGIAVARHVPQLASIGPWIAASAYVVVLGIVLAWRFESGAWRKIHLLDGKK